MGFSMHNSDRDTGSGSDSENDHTMTVEEAGKLIIDWGETYRGKPLARCDKDWMNWSRNQVWMRRNRPKFINAAEVYLQYLDSHPGACIIGFGKKHHGERLDECHDLSWLQWCRMQPFAKAKFPLFFQAVTDWLRPPPRIATRAPLQESRRPIRDTAVQRDNDDDTRRLADSPQQRHYGVKRDIGRRLTSADDLLASRDYEDDLKGSYNEDEYDTTDGFVVPDDEPLSEHTIGSEVSACEDSATSSEVERSEEEDEVEDAGQESAASEVAGIAGRPVIEISDDDSFDDGEAGDPALQVITPRRSALVAQRSRRHEAPQTAERSSLSQLVVSYVQGSPQGPPRTPSPNPRKRPRPSSSQHKSPFTLARPGIVDSDSDNEVSLVPGPAAVAVASSDDGRQQAIESSEDDVPRLPQKRRRTGSNAPALPPTPQSLPRRREVIYSDVEGGHTESSEDDERDEGPASSRTPVTPRRSGRYAKQKGRRAEVVFDLDTDEDTSDAVQSGRASPPLRESRTRGSQTVNNSRADSRTTRSNLRAVPPTPVSLRKSRTRAERVQDVINVDSDED